MKKSRKSWMWLLALVVLASGVSVAQEEEEGEGPLYPYFFVIHASVEAGMAGDYAGAVAKVVEAHAQHENPNYWAAFTPVIGGSNPRFYYFLPIQKMGDIDGWTPNAEIISASLGEEAGEVIATLQNASDSSNSIIAYSPALSNPDPEQTPGPSPYIFALRSRVKDDMMEDYIALVQELKAAHNAHEKGFKWNAYMSFIGGQGSTVHYFIGMSEMGDMDNWPKLGEVIASHHGPEKAAELQKKLSEMVKSETSIWRLVPGFSHLPSE